jgi:hypothetical protein
MLNFLISAIILAASTTASAEDLPNNTIITNRSSLVSINDLKTVAITNDSSEVRSNNGNRVIHINAALEVGLSVEGNLCESKADDAFISISPEKEDQAALALHRKFAADPFSDIFSACAAYSAPRDVTVAVRLYDYAFNTGYEKTFSIATSYDRTRVILVKVRYDDSHGLVASIER